MHNIVEQIKERYAKALSKVDRVEKALETARSELVDIEAALRVIDSITTPEGAGSKRSGSQDAMPERQSNIVRMLPVGVKNGAEPKELHSKFSMLFDSELSLDTFRTTIWRMKDKEYNASGDAWVVRNEGGRYWKDVANEADAPDPFADYGRTASERNAPPWDDDLEVPF